MENNREIVKLEFILKLNKNIICQRYFNVKNFNNRVLSSHLLHEVMTDIKESIEVGDGGAVCFVRHQLPNHYIKTPDGDTAVLETLHINSFNAAWPYQATVGALQNACTNHQVFLGHTAGIYKARHTDKLNIADGAAQMNKVMGVLDRQNEIWAKWANTPVSSTKAFKHISDATGSKFALGKLKEGESPATIMTMPTAYRNSSLMYACLLRGTGGFKPHEIEQ